MKFKVNKMRLSIGKRKGATVYYAHQVDVKHITWRQVEEAIAVRTGLSRVALNAAMIAMSDYVREELLRGNSVDLCDLGSFRAVASAKRVATAEEVTAETIYKPRIQFRAKHRLRELSALLPIHVTQEQFVATYMIRKGKKPVVPGSEGSGSSTTQPPSGGEGSSATPPSGGL